MDLTYPPIILLHSIILITHPTTPTKTKLLKIPTLQLLHLLQIQFKLPHISTQVDSKWRPKIK